MFSMFKKDDIKEDITEEELPKQADIVIDAPLENAHSGDCKSNGKVEYYGNKLVTHCSFCSKIMFRS